jgi:hypothetical protein
MGLSNYLPSSRISQSGVCTSSTRPASPYEGQVIYETDTDRVLVWNASAWVMPNSTTANPPGLELVHTGSFTNATEYIPPSEVFSTNYNHYQIKLTIDSFNNTGVTYLQMRNSGGTSTTEYRWAGYQSYSDSSIGANIFSGGAVTTGFLMQSLDFDNAVHDGISTTMELMNVSRPIYTTASGITYAAINPQYYARFLFQKHQVNTAWTNFRLNFVGTSFNCTGTVSLYGYRN